MDKIRFSSGKNFVWTWYYVFASFLLVLSSCTAGRAEENAHRKKVVPLPFLSSVGAEQITDDYMHIQRDFYLFGKIFVGTPRQPVAVRLESSTSHFWVESEDYCDDQAVRNENALCRKIGSYDRHASTTALNGPSLTSATYDDSTFAHLEYVKDVVKVGVDSEFEGYVGVGVTGSAVPGRLGLGLVGRSKSSHAEIFIMGLKKATLIEGSLYSMYTMTNSHTSGMVLFGGIDTSQFYGELKTYTTLFGHQSKYIMSVVVDYPRSTRKYNAALTYDSFLSYIPFDVLENVASYFGPGAKYNSAYGTYVVDCGYRMLSADSTILFSFTSYGSGSEDFTHIEVPLSSLVYKINVQESGSHHCILSVVSPDRPTGAVSGTGTHQEYNIGWSILRYAYVVYDFQNKNVSMAQSVSGDYTGSNITVIGDDGIRGTIKGEHRAFKSGHHSIFGYVQYFFYRNRLLFSPFLILIGIFLIYHVRLNTYRRYHKPFKILV
ncbi:aspartic peptidase domain-containing protein [Dipodascopsis uninucleata]